MVRQVDGWRPASQIGSRRRGDRVARDLRAALGGDEAVAHQDRGSCDMGACHGLNITAKVGERDRRARSPARMEAIFLSARITTGGLAAPRNGRDERGAPRPASSRANRYSSSGSADRSGRWPSCSAARDVAPANVAFGRGEVVPEVLDQSLGVAVTGPEDRPRGHQADVAHRSKLGQTPLLGVGRLPTESNSVSPPRANCRSPSATRAPAYPAVSAADSPVTPPPTTRTSQPPVRFS